MCHVHEIVSVKLNFYSNTQKGGKERKKWIQNDLYFVKTIFKSSTKDISQKCFNILYFIVKITLMAKVFIRTSYSIKILF